MSEAWTNQYIFCAACGQSLRRAQANQAVLDFYCSGCSEQYELKSKRGLFSARVVDGAYDSMMARLKSAQAPNFFFLSYEPTQLQVLDFFVIPGYFFALDTIEKRPALSPSARRAGWVGCNILLDQIPESGRIHYVKNRNPVPEKTVTAAWSKTSFLKGTKDLELKGWTIDVMRCIESRGLGEFSLADAYGFEQELQGRHPKNNHVRDKIRQQLQKLRDKGYLEFKGRGSYRLIP